MHLSKYASRVTLLVRGNSLTASMSDYLINEIEATENVRVRSTTRVMGGGGPGRLEHLTLQDSTSGQSETVPAAALFVLIGAEPHTGWLPEEIERDEKGFIITGQDLLRTGESAEGWTLERPPLPLETSVPGVFAVGDVRHRSVKRVVPRRAVARRGRGSPVRCSSSAGREPTASPWLWISSAIR